MEGSFELFIESKILSAGPFAFVQYVPGEPILPKPNEGSVKRRNEKKRIRLRRAFILVRVWLIFFSSFPAVLTCLSILCF